MCAIDDAEPCDFWRSTMQKTRKVRMCIECGKRIAVGETYQRDVFLAEGWWSSYVTCLDCVNGPCEWLRKECGGYLVGYAQEDLQEHFNERAVTGAALFKLGRLIVRMKHQYRPMAKAS